MVSNDFARTIHRNILKCTFEIQTEDALGTKIQDTLILNIFHIALLFQLQIQLLSQYNIKQHSQLLIDFSKKALKSGSVEFLLIKCI